MSLSGISPVVQYDLAIKDEQKAADTYIKTDPLSKRYVDSFRSSASRLASTKQLMRDYAANQVVLGAYNLKSMANQPGLESRLLNENPYNNKSTAAKSHNAAWMSFADAFYKMSVTDITMEELPEPDTTTPILDNKFIMSPDFLGEVLQQYKYNKLESALPEGGVGDAVYFTRQFQEGKVRTVDDILKDPTLLNVAINIYDLNTDDFNSSDFDKQKEILAKKIDFDSLKGADGKIDKGKAKSFSKDASVKYIKNMNKDNTGNELDTYIDQYNEVISDEKKSADSYFLSIPGSTDDMDSFLKQGASIQTVDDLMQNDVVNKIVLGAFRLDDLISDPQRERRLLRENPYQRDSFVAKSSKLGNSAGARSFADSFYNIKLTKGTASMLPQPDKTSQKMSGDIIVPQDFIEKTIGSYELRQYETSKDLDKSGVGNALYFTRTMQQGKIKDVNSLMSDATLVKILEVVNGMNPDDIGSLDFKQQKNIISRLFNINDFTKPNPNPTAADGSDERIPDPKKIQHYAERYLAVVQLHPDWNSVDQPAGLLDLFGGSNDENWVVSLFA